jgi:hypothetical protein
VWGGWGHCFLLDEDLVNFHHIKIVNSLRISVLS